MKRNRKFISSLSFMMLMNSIGCASRQGIGKMSFDGPMGLGSSRSGPYYERQSENPQVALHNFRLKITQANYEERTREVRIDKEVAPLTAEEIIQELFSLNALREFTLTISYASGNSSVQKAEWLCRILSNLPGFIRGVNLQCLEAIDTEGFSHIVTSLPPSVCKLRILGQYDDDEIGYYYAPVGRGEHPLLSMGVIRFKEIVASLPASIDTLILDQIGFRWIEYAQIASSLPLSVRSLAVNEPDNYYDTPEQAGAMLRALKHTVVREFGFQASRCVLGTANDRWDSNKVPPSIAQLRALLWNLKDSKASTVIVGNLRTEDRAMLQPLVDEFNREIALPNFLNDLKLDESLEHLCVESMIRWSTEHYKITSPKQAFKKAIVDSTLPDLLKEKWIDREPAGLIFN